MANSDLIIIGKLGAAYGVKGQIKFFPYSGETEYLLSLKEAFIKRDSGFVKLTVEDVTDHHDHVVLKFRSYDSPESVKELSGTELLASRQSAAPLAENQFYYADLCSCDLLLNNKKIAVVKSVCEGGGVLLEVELLDKKMLFIPFRKEFIGKVDIEAKTIELISPWILDQVDSEN